MHASEGAASAAEPVTGMGRISDAAGYNFGVQLPEAKFLAAGYYPMVAELQVLKFVAAG